MSEPLIRPFRAQDRDWLVEQHGIHYARDEGFDESFGVLVGDIIDAFVVKHNPDLERGWIAEQDGVRLGSIFCVTQSANTAKLRLFLLVPKARGKGVGKLLLATCMGFARDCGYSGMQLWTHESHAAACALYRKTGWQMIEAKPVHSFGQDLIEQSWRFDF